MMGEVVRTRMAKLKPLKTLAVSFVNTLLVVSTLAWNVQTALAQTAALIPNAKQQFFNANGDPLAGGSVFSYVPNTTTPKTTWVDPFEATPNANPVVLDAGGGAFIFGQGNYRQVVKDAQGNLIWDGFTSAYGSSAPSGSNGTDTAPVGTVMPFAGSAVPVNWQLAYGQALSRTTFAQLETAITIGTFTGNATSTSTTISGFTSTSQVPVGAPVECSCLPTGTTVASITNATTLVVSQAATATGTFTVTVFPWGNGDGVTTFNVPDLRGRTFAGADAMGGTAASRLTSAFYGASASTPGVAGGAQSQTLATSNIPQFQFTPSGTVSGTNGGSQTLADVFATGGASNFLAQSGTGNSFQNLTVNGSNFSWSGSFNGNQISIGQASPGAFGVIQPTLTVNYIIKVAPNTTGAGGVTSLGGMFGDIVCGAGLTCAPVAGVNTIEVTSVPVANIVVNSTTVTGGCGGGVLWQNGTVQSLCPVVGGVYSVSGGSLPQVSTTLPDGLAMGTPSSLILTNATGLPLGSGVSGLLPLANGGTNANLTPNAGGVIYSTASALGVLNNPNSNGECLLSGTSAPTWGSCSGAAPAVATVGNAAADTTLTIAGTGSGPWDGNVTVALNLANANSWTATQSFVGNGSAANVILDTAGVSELDTIHLKDNGAIKWQIEKDSANNFIIHDQGGARNDLLIASSGDMSLMPSGGALTLGSTGSVINIPNSALLLFGQTGGSTDGSIAEFGSNNLTISAGQSNTVGFQNFNGATRYASIGASNTFFGNVYMGGGNPWVDVRSGANGCAAATGNGSTDDSAAIQCQATYLDTHFAGGILWLGLGNYLLGSTLNIPCDVLIGGANVASTFIGVTTDMTAINFVNSSGTCGIAGGGFGGLLRTYVYGFEGSGATANLVTVADNLVINMRDCRINGGNWALEENGIDGDIDNCYIAGWGSGGGNILSTGANWYIRDKLDQGATLITWAFKQLQSFSGASSGENHFTQVDFSGSYVPGGGSIFVDDRSAGGTSDNAITVVTDSVLSGQFAINNGKFSLFTGDEFSVNSSSNNPIAITGSGVTGGGITISGSGSRSCAGNISITC